jgi:hypothetical protein
MMKKTSKNPRRPQGPTRRNGKLNPSQFESNVKGTHRFRFAATAAVTQKSITDSSVIGALGGFCTIVNNQVSCWVNSFRIKKIEVWGAPQTLGSPSTVSVEWFGFGNSPNLEISDTTLSVSQNAHVVTRPPPNALCHFWQKQTNTALFNLSCTANSIIDITVDYVLVDQDTAALAIAVAAGVVGTPYYLALDQQTGTHNFVPVSLATTF